MLGKHTGMGGQMSDLSRRGFLKISGVTAGALAASGAFGRASAAPEARRAGERRDRHLRAQETLASPTWTHGFGLRNGCSGGNALPMKSGQRTRSFPGS